MADAKKKKKLIIQISAGITILVLLLGLGYMLFFAGEEAPKESSLGDSDAMLPLDPAAVDNTAATAAANSALVLNPTAIVLSPEAPIAEFQVMASGNPIVIEDVRIPQDQVNFLSVSNIDCPAKPTPLIAGATCRVSVKMIGAQGVNTAIEVLASAQSTGGTSELKQSVSVTSQGAGGTAPNGMPVDGTINGGITNTGVPAPVGTSAIPSEAPPPSNPAPAINYGSSSGSGSAPAGTMSPRQEMRAQYLQARRGGLNALQPRTMAPAPRSPYASWNSVGIKGSNSSYPVDMSRVITPDKPITAVLNNIIDTRSAVTAVATVDRDVYGNNGRTVVIARGSKLVGTVSGGEERVGVAWKQVIRPDGVRFAIDAASGDAMGRGGIPGRVNERNIERYGYSLLPTAASAIITAALGGNQTTTVGVGGATQQRSARSIAAEILSEPLQQIADDIYKRKSTMQTQIVVPAGTRITVWAVDDLRLKPLGESDRDESQQQQNNQNSGGSQGGFVYNPSNNGGGNGGNSQTQPRAPVQQPQQPQGDGRSEGNANGAIDANGNYVPVRTSSPAPGSGDLNNGRFPTANNPWGR